MKRQCTVPFCDKYTPRSKERFCSSHRNEFFIRKISPYKELPPIFTFKKCNIHGWQKINNFYHHSSNNTYICKLCHLSKMKDKYCPIKRKLKKQKEWLVQKNSSLKRNFNITYADYLALLTKQNNRCEICKSLNSSKKHFHVDHCHKTGKVRGLLCRKCNTGLGFFDDNPELLIKAAEYINRL